MASRAKGPSRELSRRLASLKLLVSTDSFSRWPLTLRFFCGDVYEAWIKTCIADSPTLPPGIKVVLDIRQAEPEPEAEIEEGEPAPKKKKRGQWAANGVGGVQALDISFAPLEQHYWKAKTLVDMVGEDLECAVCEKPFEGRQMLFCSHGPCGMVAHLTCLAKEFLANGDGVLPVAGECPGCSMELAWADLVRELSLRERTMPLIEAKKKAASEKRRNAIGRDVVRDEEEEEEEEDEEDEDEDEEQGEGDVTAMDIADVPEGLEAELDDMRRELELDCMLAELSDEDHWKKMKKEKMAIDSEDEWANVEVI